MDRHGPNLLTQNEESATTLDQGLRQSRQNKNVINSNEQINDLRLSKAVPGAIPQALEQ